MIHNGFSSEFLDRVRAKNDIVDVVSKYVTLTRRGLNFWACCPFHNEKTPSFSVKQDGQFFKCFGCGESGNVFTFIMKMENVDFPTSVEILAKNAGLELPTDTENEEMKKRKHERDRVYAVLKATTEFYHKNLIENPNSEQAKYLKERGLSREMIEKFQIGASLNFDSLPEHLRKLGFTAKEMMSAGVVGTGNDNRIYDFYGKRLIFPIFNGFGDVVAYSGRSVTPSPEHTKYKNTPQTIVFNKSEILFGYNFARDLKKEHMLDTLVIVEGHIDVIACHQVGITNTIGCMGTALTTLHAKKIKQLVDNVILCLDGDNAGNMATYKAIDVLKQVGLNVRVVRLVAAKDPDEFIKKFGKDNFLEVLTNSIDCVDFILTDSAKKYNLENNSEKNQYTQEALNYISKFSTPAEQEIYLKEVQKLVKIPIDALRKSMQKSEVKETCETIENLSDTPSNNYILESKIMLLASILYKKIENFENFSGLFGSNDELSELYKFLVQKKNANEDVTVSSLFDNFDISKNSLIDRVINYVFPETDVYNQLLSDTIKRVNQLKIDDELKELKAKLSNVKSNEELTETLKRMQELTVLKNKEKMWLQ